jgi:RimJ/RimL family protein N-acetyltransferase
MSIIRKVELTMDDARIGESLKWIVNLLDHHHIPYQIIGGLAAHAYGAARPVVDIDLYLPMGGAQAALAEMKPYLVRPPRPHRSVTWDLTYLVLDHNGVQIEIGDSSTSPRFYNHKDQCWDPQIINYAASQRATLFGVEVNVMPRAELISYKTRMDREVDHADLHAMDPASHEAGNDLKDLSPVVPLVLHADAFDGRKVDDLIAGLKEEGFQFTSMAELGNTGEAQHKLYLLNDTTAMDTDGPDGGHVWPSFEDFQKDVCQMDWFLPRGQIIAIDTANSAWAAMSAITRFEGSGNTWNLFTGVDRRYRGRMLEQAVLVLAIRYALDELKVNSIFADESRSNLPMIAVYHELGYIPRP